jgi:hypothetical protein
MIEHEPGLPFDEPDDAPDFGGQTYERAKDHARLGAQALRVWKVVSDGRWRTLREIEGATGDPQASISARLRDYRKPEFGSNKMESRRRGDGKRGLFEYRVTPNPQGWLFPLANPKGWLTALERKEER